MAVAAMAAATEAETMAAADWVTVGAARATAAAGWAAASRVVMVVPTEAEVKAAVARAGVARAADATASCGARTSAAAGCRAADGGRGGRRRTSSSVRGSAGASEAWPQPGQTASASKSWATEMMTLTLA